MSFVQKLPSAALGGGASSLQSVAFTSNPTIGNTIIVPISCFTSSTISTLTVSDTAGNSYTVDGFVEHLSDVGNYQHAAVARAKVTATGANFKITVSSGVTSSDFYFNAVEFSGIDGLALVATPKATGANAHTTTSLTVGPLSTLDRVGCLLIGAFGVESSTTNAGISDPATFSGPTFSTASTSISVNQDGSTIDGGQFSYAIASSKTAPSAQWTYTNDTNTWPQYCGVLVAYAPTITLGAQTATFTEGTPTDTVSYGVTGQTATFTEGTITASTGGNVSVNLTGQTATFSEGALSLNIGYSLNDGVPLTGQTATFAEGAPTETLSYALTGQTGTLSEGTVGSNVTYTLGSQTATFTEGTISASAGGNVTLTLSGQTVTATEGALTSNLLAPLTAQTGTFTEGTLTDALSTGLTGQSITASEGTITAQTTGDVNIQLGSLSASFQMGLMTLGGQTPAGRHRRRFGVIDDGRLLIFDTRAEADEAKRTIAARDLPKTKNARKIKVKPLPPAVEAIPLETIAAAAEVAGESAQYQALLTEPVPLAEFYEALKARQEEEDTALHLLRTDREERLAHLGHITQALIDLLGHLLRRRR